MVVGEIAEAADFLVVGGGPGGYAAALRAAQLGRDVTLVDRGGVGGVCLREGCVPSKALIEVADRVAGYDALGEAGVAVADVRFDMAAFQGWKDGIVGRLTGGVRKLLDDAGVDVVGGELRFTRPNQAVVAGPGQPRFLEFADAVIAPGSRQADLAELPRDGDWVLDSTDALALDRLPASLVVVGGGYIGLELGTAFAKLGSAVTIVEQADELLPTLDARLLRPVRQRLRRLGVDVHTRATVVDGDGSAVTVRTADGDKVRAEAERVVVAVGRTPNTADLGLDQIGVAAGPDGLVDVGPDRRATDHVAAIGDVTTGPALAHKAIAEAHVAAEALCGRRVAFQPEAIPMVVFSDPEVASAGLTVDAARERGLDATATRFPLGASGRAATLGTSDGFCQLVVDTDTDSVVGVHLVGPHASDLVAEGVLAIELGASTEDLALTVHPHPTLSEQLAEAAHLALGRPVHVRGRT